MLNRFNHLVTGQFNNRANLAVPSHLVDWGDYRSAISRENTFISNEVERKKWLDEKLANIEANESRKYDNQLVRQAELNRETVRMIKELDEYDKARRLRQDISGKTEIQEINSASYQPNEIADNYESRTQVKDYSLYEANALPYKQGGVHLGIWRGGSPRQYVTFASDLLQPKGAGDVLTGEWSSVMDSFGNHGDYQYDSDAIPAPLVGIDNVEEYEEELFQFVKSHQGEIEMAVKAAGNAVEGMGPFDIFQFIMMKVPMPPNGKAFMIAALFILAFCECAQKATQKKQLNVRVYMAKHNCSQEEAEAHISYFDLLFAEVGAVLTEEWVAKTLQIWGMPKKIAEKLTYLCFAVLKMFDEYRRILQKELYYL